MFRNYLIKIRTFLNKDKLFVKDALLNMTAFAIYIISQHIVLLPSYAKLLNEDDYAIVIVFINVMNVFCYVLGSQIGVTHQLQKSQYSGRPNAEIMDFSTLMLWASLLIMIAFPCILIILHVDTVSIVFFTITVILSNYRLYVRHYFRMNSTYKYTISQNIFYLIGIVIGIFSFPFFDKIWAPLFFGELLALLYTLFVVPQNSISFHRSYFFNDTLKRYSGLGMSSALSNAVTLTDKLLVFPLLGAYPLAVYNAGTATSKILSLVMNPLNEVILVRLAKSKKDDKDLIKTIISISLVVIVVLFIIIVPIIYVFSGFLYKQYLDDICSIIVILSFGCSISTTSSVMKNFILRYAKASELTFCYIINLIIIVVVGMLGAKFFGLVGFAGAVLIGQIELWISFIIVLYNHLKKIDFIEKNAFEE